MKDATSIIIIAQVLTGQVAYGDNIIIIIA